MRPQSRRISWLAVLFFPLFALNGCSKDKPHTHGPEGHTHEKPEPKGPLVLEVDPTIEKWKDLPDRSTIADKRSPWDNFAMDDDLAKQFRAEGKSAPFPRKWTTWERYKSDFVGAILRQGKIDFTVVDSLYRGDFFDWKNWEDVIALLEAGIAESGGDPAYKGNFILGLIHIGFDDKVLEVVKEYEKESWFKDNWDVNFFVGALHFRHRRYLQALPYLERAYELHPDQWARIWLMLALTQKEGEASAKRREELFSYGPHMGQSGNTEFPFRDMADKLGIRRWHLAGAMAFMDVNNDTFLDFVANGVWASPELYIFQPGEGYVLTREPTLQGISNTPPGCVAADFDNDGFTDLYMTRAAWLSGGPNRLLKNDGGKGFIDQSHKGDAALAFQNSCGVAALDFNRDSLVDLVVTGTSGGTVRLLKNEGDFVFKDVTVSAGIAELTAITIGVCAGDVNNDGWPDFFVNSVSPREGEERRPYDPKGLPSSKQNMTPDALYINQKDGTFKNVAEEAGVAYGTPVGFASWMFDYDNDGDLDILAANFVENPDNVLNGFIEKKKQEGLYKASALFRNDGNLKFTDISEKAGFVPASIMGATFGDFDLDGDQDIVLGPGRHALENAQPLFVYRNEGQDQFTNITPLHNPHFFGKFHGMATADLDRDGDPELYVNNGGVMLSDRWRDMVLENTTTGRNWLHLRLEGVTSNKSAIGARITVHVGDKIIMQEVAAGQGFSSTNSPYLIFGLGEAKQADKVEIRWPNGNAQTLPALGANQALIVTEDKDTFRRIY